MQDEKKRLFFGLEVLAPWPSKLPHGRLLEESGRHLTLAFLGQVPYAGLFEQLPTIPLPSRSIGFAGQFDACLFLPKRHPHVAAWHVQWANDGDKLDAYQKQLTQWIKDQGLPVDEKGSFLSHVTICRSPFQIQAWKRAFTPLPLIAHQLHLYESLGHSRYKACWTHSLKPPFEEIEHTADIAFVIRAEALQHLYQHAYLALAFKFPLLLGYFAPQAPISDLDDIVIHLNNAIAQADAAAGCPFKAISFHGSIQEEEDKTLTWEMIVDV